MTLDFRQGDRLLVSITDPVPFIDVADIKDHLRVNHSEEDDLIEAMTAAAVSSVETRVQRLLSPRDIVVRLAGLPSGRCPVMLAGGVVTEVTNVEVGGEAFDGCEAIGSSPSMLLPPSDWPQVDPVGYPVEIAYTAGYAAPPADLVVAVKLICGALYENREATSAMASNVVPIGAEYLMSPYRIWPT